MSWLVGGVVIFFVFVVLRWMVVRAFGSGKTSVAVLTRIDTKAQEEAKSIVKTAESEKLEVANAGAETLLQRVRARVARGLRK